jgi:hypothetical protein
MNRRRMMMLQENSPSVLYLYNYGDECIDVTGGWHKQGYIRGIYALAEKRENEMILTASNNTSVSTVTMCTVRPIDISEYKYICIDWDYSTTVNGMTRMILSDHSENSIDMNQAFGNYFSKPLFGEGSVTNTFSGVERKEILHELLPPTPLYFNFLADKWMNVSSNNKVEIKVRRVWLEK